MCFAKSSVWQGRIIAVALVNTNGAMGACWQSFAWSCQLPCFNIACRRQNFLPNLIPVKVCAPQIFAEMLQRLTGRRKREPQLTANSPSASPSSQSKSPCTKPQKLTLLIAKHQLWCFLSHVQARGGDAAHVLALLVPQLLNGWYGWFDMLEENSLDAESMQAGVRASKTFALFLVQEYASSFFCLLELCTALLETDLAMVLVLEMEAARGQVKDVKAFFNQIADQINFYCGLGEDAAERKGQNAFAPYFSQLPTVKFTGQAILARFHKSVQFNRSNPEVTARALLGKPVSKTSVLDGKNAQVLLLCNAKVALDQAHLLVLMFASNKVKARVVRRDKDFDPTLPVVVFCAQSVSQDPVLVKALQRFNPEQQRLVLVHEADGRRVGGMQEAEQTDFGAAMFQGIGNAQYFMDRKSQSIEFTKGARSAQFSAVFVEKVLNTIGLAPALPFASLQPKLCLLKALKVGGNAAVGEWVLQESGFSEFTDKLLLLKQPAMLGDLPRDRVVAFIDCSVETSDESVLRSSLLAFPATTSSSTRKALQPARVLTGCARACWSLHWRMFLG